MTTNDKRKKCLVKMAIANVIIVAIVALVACLPSPYGFIILAVLMNITAFGAGIALVRDENKRIMEKLEEDTVKTYLGLEIVTLQKERDAIKSQVERLQNIAEELNELSKKILDVINSRKNELNNLEVDFSSFTNEAKHSLQTLSLATNSWNHCIEGFAKASDEMIEEADKAKEEFLALSESNAALKYENEGLEQKIEEKKALLKQDHIMVFNTPYYPSTFLSKHVHETYLPKYAKSVLGDKFLQVGNIVELSEDCFARIPGVGDQTITAVKKLLAQHDLYLGCSDIICINGQWYTKG